ncbi:uncharacterized protein C1orf21 homolog isoform X2 [Hemibagrus wyckioides]|uniref:uncharacterized protein C1orf21 homolog isoform X2 n=1 Tax=Hemibagrus wyckioides TaxID=337641 RepID=UPI00266D94ED|nr:uncharacterized protein C1orf21 homolog isoform X2 [Hemibagrus wyckioides]
MGCASAKQLSSVPGDEEDRDKAHSNGDAFSSDEYKLKGVEKVKYMHGEEERMNTRNQEHLEKSTFLHKGKHKEHSLVGEPAGVLQDAGREDRKGA